MDTCHGGSHLVFLEPDGELVHDAYRKRTGHRDVMTFVIMTCKGQHGPDIAWSGIDAQLCSYLVDTDLYLGNEVQFFLGGIHFSLTP